MKPEYKDFLNKLENILAKSERIIITTHRSPDDDAIGSLLSAYSHFFRKYPEKFVSMVISGNDRNRWHYFKNSDKITFVGDMTERLDDADVIIFLDGAEYHRFSESPERFTNFTGETICIDHHASAPDNFIARLTDISSTSASEMVYHLFYEKIEKIETKDAETLLLGIIGDTGSFEYVTPEKSGVFEIAKRLVEEGNISLQKMRAQYSSYTERELAIMGEFIRQKKIIGDISGWPAFSVFSVSRKFLSDNDYNDSEGAEAKNIIVSLFGTKLENAPWGISLQPTSDGGVKASFRSIPGGPNVRLIAEGLGVGGGHDLASGAKFVKENKELEADDIIEKITSWMKKNPPVMTD